MSNQLNDCLLKPLCSLKKAVARLWSPKPRPGNLNSATANRRPGFSPPILRTPSSANRAVDAGPTVVSEMPDHLLTIGYDYVKRHIEETGNSSQNGLCSPKILFTVANKSYIVTPTVYLPTHPSNLPIDRASTDSDSHMLKHQSANIGTTNFDISATVPLNTNISPASSIMDDEEIAVTGMITLYLTFLLIKLISILICSNFAGDQAGGLSHETVQPLQQPSPIFFGLCSLEILLFHVTDSFGTDASSKLPIVDLPRLKSSGKYHN